MTTDDLASGVLDILLDSGHQTKGELLRITKASEREVDEALTHLERTGSAYFVNGRWFVSSKVIAHRAFFEAFSKNEPPSESETFGKFLKEIYAAGRCGGVSFEEAWILAKRRIGAA